MNRKTLAAFAGFLVATVALITTPLGQSVGNNGSGRFTGGVTSTSVTNTGALVESGIIRPAGVTGALNNWAPTGITTARVVIPTLTGATTLSSIAAGQVDGRRLDLCATGGFTLTIKTDDGATGTAANRFLLAGALDWTLGSTGQSCAKFFYDGTAARWRMDAKTGTAFPGFENLGVTTLSGEQVYSTTGTTNDLALNAATTTLRYTGAGNATFTGFTGGVNGRVLIVTDESTGTITLSDNATSVAANQLSLVGAVTGYINNGSSAIFRYDGTAARWRLISTSSTYTRASIQVNGNFSLGASAGEQTDTSTGVVNDFSLTANVTVLRWNGASSVTISGLTGGANGRTVLVVNENTTINVTVTNEAAGSTAANRVATTGGGSVVIGAGGGAVLRYDGTASRWRVAALNTLTSGGTYSFNSGITFFAVNSPAAISGTNNDFAPGGGGYRVRVALSAAATITGLASNVAAGRIVHFQNLSTSFNLTLANESSSSSAANRFTNVNNVDLVIPPLGSALAIYDGTTTRWITYGGAGAYSQASNTLSGDRIGTNLASGRYYFEPNTNSLTTLLLPQGQMRCIPSYIPNPVTIVRLGSEVTVVGDVGSKLRLGVYGDDGNGRPGTLVVDGGQIAGDSVAVQELTVSAAVGPGWYHFCEATQSVVTTAPTIRATNTIVNSIVDAGTTIPGASATASAYVITGITGALPASAGTPTSSFNGPRIFVKTL